MKSRARSDPTTPSGKAPSPRTSTPAVIATDLQRASAGERGGRSLRCGRLQRVGAGGKGTAPRKRTRPRPTLGGSGC